MPTSSYMPKTNRALSMSRHVNGGMPNCPALLRYVCAGPSLMLSSASAPIPVSLNTPCPSISQFPVSKAGWINPAHALFSRPASIGSFFKKCCPKASPRRNLVTDAHLAALASEHGCVLMSTDTDFSRFPGIKWRNPLK